MSDKSSEKSKQQDNCKEDKVLNDNNNNDVDNSVEEQQEAIPTPIQQEPIPTPIQQEPTLEEQLDKAKEDILRLMADMQNTRRIADNDVMAVRKYGAATLARDLFSVNDNLRMALMSISDDDKKSNSSLKNLYLGLEMVANEFDSAFEKNHIKKILPNVGDDFNHEHHQAMSEVDNNDIEVGKIAQVLSAGYILHDRLLKPAMVNIVKKSK